MPDQHPEDEDDLETRVNGPGASAPGGSSPGGGDAPGHDAPGDAVDFDLESIPRPPRGRPPSGTQPGGRLPLPPGVTRPPVHVSKLPDVEPDPDAPRDPTVADTPSSEVPTSEVDGGRGVATQAGGFAGEGTQGPGPQRPPATVPEADEESATVADAGLTERQKALLEHERSRGPESPGATSGDVGAGSATPRMQGPVPASKFSRGTARDPIAGTAAARGSVPGRAAPSQLTEGMLLADRYELVRRLGKGGMGEVWQARHTLLQGMRAIKVIKASISRDPAFRARFLSEGQTMMRVKHEGVVEVTDLDETRQNRELFMVMEYLQGRTVQLAVRDPLEPLCNDLRNVARIFRLLALGMQRIHDERIVHKDLKSDNVLLVTGEDGLEHPKVIDFGLAKRLGEKGDRPPAEGGDPAAEGRSDPDLRTTLSGTLAYMAPEQFAGEPSSFQSDIYAYGVMLYECFTKGEYPMPRGSLGEYIDRHKKGSPPNRLRQARPDLDPFLAELADRCMAPAREQRPKSFDEIARDLQWWLDIPKRAKRRRLILLVAGTAALLVGGFVWGVFFSGTKASVGTFQFRTSAGGPDGTGGAELPARGGAWYLPNACLADVRVTGDVTGEPGTPSLAVDGEPREAVLTIESRTNERGERRPTLVGSLDLNDLTEGDHALEFRVAEGADPSTARIHVDRTPPVIGAVTLPGGGAETLTNADNPGLWITVGEPQSDLSSVEVARIDAEGRAVRWIPANPDPNDPRRWNVTGVHEGDGEQVVRVRATDFAGNVSAPREFRFVRDTAKPAVQVAGLFRERLSVREPSGNPLQVTTTEPARLVVTFLRGGEVVPVEIRRDLAQSFDVDLPDVPAQGAAITVTATDAAGNASVVEDGRTRFPVSVVPDVVTIDSPGGRTRWAPRQGDEVVLRVHREYALPATFGVTLARVLDEDGAPAPGAAADEPGAVVQVDPGTGVDAQVRLPATLRAGEYAVALTGLGAARVEPFRLVVDPAPPDVVSVTVADGEGNPVGAGEWARTQDLRATVEVADLSLRSLTIADTAPAEAPEPGRHRYTFALRLAQQGETALQLVAEDEAGRRTQRTVPVRADWADPVITLTSPQSGDALSDDTPAAFAGTCSESEYKLLVTAKGREPSQASHRERSFDDRVLLEAGEQDVTVVAQDLAGRRSAPVHVRVTVAQKRVLPDQVTWDTGVPSEMRQVAPGAIVVGGLTQPVSRCFLDLTEVTNRQYRAFLAACDEHAGKKTPWDHADQPAGWSHVPPAETWNDPKWNADDLPVVNVSWWDAWAYARWSGRRLPTEGEWVKAAAQKDGELELRSWPPFADTEWKDGVLATAEATSQKGPVDATKGGDVSPVGCLHMGGNVSEWVDLPYAPKGEPTTGVRGGSFWTTRVGADVRRVPTKPYDRSFRARTIGFRCAVDADKVRR